MPTIIEKINVVKHVTKHLSNPNYSLTHRRIVGGSLIVVGFTMLHVASGFGAFHYVSEFFGLVVHAVGTVPFIGHLEHHDTTDTTNNS